MAEPSRVFAILLFLSLLVVLVFIFSSSSSKRVSRSPTSSSSIDNIILQSSSSPQHSKSSSNNNNNNDIPSFSPNSISRKKKRRLMNRQQQLQQQQQQTDDLAPIIVSDNVTDENGYIAGQQQSQSQHPPLPPEPTLPPFSVPNLPSGEKVFETISDHCATIFEDGTFIANAFSGIRFLKAGKYKNDEKLTIPTCNIDGAIPTMRPMYPFGLDLPEVSSVSSKNSNKKKKTLPQPLTTQEPSFSFLNASSSSSSSKSGGDITIRITLSPPTPPPNKITEITCDKSFDVAIVGDLYRPQHTMQFLFSLMGFIALQSELQLYGAKNVPIFLNVLRYAAVASAKEFCREKFPHFELLDLLLPSGKDRVNEENGIYLFRDAGWGPHEIKAKDFAAQATAYSSSSNEEQRKNNRIAGECLQHVRGSEPVTTRPTVLFRKNVPAHLLTPPPPVPIIENETLSEEIAGKTNFCIKKKLIWGSLPVRIPGSRIQPNLSILKPKYFQDIRQRMIYRFVNKPSQLHTRMPKGHILLVRRSKENGRFLYKDMEVANQVRKSLAALDEFASSASENNNTKTDASSGTQNVETDETRNREIIVVSWEDMNLHDQLRLVVHAKAMIGVHGNGLTWACFMPLNSFIIEFSSSLNKRNEVFEGINVANAGNIAAACGMKSLSLRSSWVESAMTKRQKKEGTLNYSHKWKMVDIVPTQRELTMIDKFIQSDGKEMY